MLKHITTLLLCQLILLLSPGLAWSAPNVAVSIKPIHGLVSSIMEGVATPHLLLQTPSSPHTFHLKPSTLRALHAAEVIIWIGPQFEQFLSKPLNDRRDNQHLITLLDIDPLTRLPLREDDAFSGHSHEQEHSHEHGHNHEHAASHHSNLDPHIWLSIDNAIVISEHIAAKLAKIDPANATQYTSNLTELKARLRQLNTELKTLLTPVEGRPFLVHHDAYQYFEQSYKLNCLGTLVFNPHVPLSAKRFNALLNKIQQDNIHCVFYEAEFYHPTMVDKLAKSDVTVTLIDPLGNQQAIGKNSYEKTLWQLGQTIASCLSKHSR